MSINTARNNVEKPFAESPNEILHRMMARDQVQNQDMVSRLSNVSSRGAQSRVTRMRFVVCILGIISLTMGQISRSVINYCITSMVDPRMLSTNDSVSSGGSCPNPQQDEQLVDLSLPNRMPEVLGSEMDGRSDFDVLQSYKHTHTNNMEVLSPTIKKIYMSRSGIDPTGDSGEDLLTDSLGEKFMWTVKQQSLIKGGFFYSYFFFQILGGRIAEVYGSKYVILVGVAGSAIINLATPWMANYSFPLLVASRVFMGAIQSAGIPAMYALLNRWLTISETSIYAPMLKMSLRIGQVLASMAPGVIPDWPNVFYLIGVCGVIWSLAWIFLSTSDPSTNKWVSEGELMHITKNKKRNNKEELEDKTSTSLRTPWLKIITSPSVIGLVIGKLASSLCNSFITIELPSYLRYVYHASVQEMSFITTFMFAIQVPLTLMAGWLAKSMVQKHPFGLSTTSIRKIFQTMTTFGTGISLLLITLSQCNLLYTGIILQVLSVFFVFVAGGETMLPFDLSDKYPATIMAIANTLSNLSGIMVTTLTGIVLADEGGSQTRWNFVIILIAVAEMLGGLLFCLLIKATQIDFDNKERQNSLEDPPEPRLSPESAICEIVPSLQMAELSNQNKQMS